MKRTAKGIRPVRRVPETLRRYQGWMGTWRAIEVVLVGCSQAEART